MIIKHKIAPKALSGVVRVGIRVRHGGDKRPKKPA